MSRRSNIFSLFKQATEFFSTLSRYRVVTSELVLQAVLQSSSGSSVPGKNSGDEPDNKSTKVVQKASEKNHKYFFVLKLVCILKIIRFEKNVFQF